jgi:hypothetical protein
MLCIPSHLCHIVIPSRLCPVHQLNKLKSTTTITPSLNILQPKMYIISRNGAQVGFSFAVYSLFCHVFTSYFLCVLILAWVGPVGVDGGERGGWRGVRGEVSLAGFLQVLIDVWFFRLATRPSRCKEREMLLEYSKRSFFLVNKTTSNEALLCMKEDEEILMALIIYEFADCICVSITSDLD